MGGKEAELTALSMATIRRIIGLFLRSALIAFALPVAGASAQTSTARALADPRATFDLLKDLHGRDFAAGGASVSRAPFPDNAFECGREAILWARRSTAPSGVDATTVQELAKSARFIACLTQSLAGRDQSLWQGKVRSFEDAEIASIVSGKPALEHFGGLVVALEVAFEDRQIHASPQVAPPPPPPSSGPQPPPPPLSSVPQASARPERPIVRPREPRETPSRDPEPTPAGIRIVTVPSGGRVSLLPMFYFQLCQAQKIDVEDRATCNYWNEFGDGDRRLLRGVHWYVASWPGGSMRRGRQDFETLPAGVPEWRLRSAD
jgi:hypothetical protein